MSLCTTCGRLLLPIGLVAMLILGLATTAQAHGTMRVELLTYTSSGRTIVETPCDAGSGAAVNCDPQFRVTADRFIHGGDGLFVYQQTGKYEDQNVVSFGSTVGIGEGPNPLVIAMDYADNLGNLRLTVYVTDYDAGPSGELMSKFTAELLASGTATTELELSSGSDRLRLRYWYACSANYHGPQCNAYCRASDDSANGHYSCGSAGEKICLYGWVNATASSCKQPHPCRTCACQHGGICEPQGEAFKCHCTGGFAGSRCENCSLPGGVGCNATAPTSTTTAAAATDCDGSACSTAAATEAPKFGWDPANVCFGVGAFVAVAAAACIGCAGAALFGIMWHHEKRRIV